MGILKDQGFLELISTPGDYIGTLYSFLGNNMEWFVTALFLGFVFCFCLLSLVFCPSLPGNFLSMYLLDSICLAFSR